MRDNEYCVIADDHFKLHAVLYNLDTLYVAFVRTDTYLFAQNFIEIAKCTNICDSVGRKSRIYLVVHMCTVCKEFHKGQM